MDKIGIKDLGEGVYFRWLGWYLDFFNEGVIMEYKVC